MALDLSVFMGKPKKTYGQLAKTPIVPVKPAFNYNQEVLKQLPGAVKETASSAAQNILKAVVGNTALGLSPQIRKTVGINDAEFLAQKKAETDIFKSAIVKRGKNLTPEESQSLSGTLIGAVDFGGVESKIAKSKSAINILEDLKGVFKKEASDLKPLAEKLVKIENKSEVNKVLNDFIQKTEIISQQSPQGLLSPVNGLLEIPGGKVVKGLDPLVESSYSESVNKLRIALQEAKPLRGQQERIYTTQRAKKINKVIEARNKLGGEKGYYEELSNLRGSMPKVEFESIRDSIAQSDIDNLFNSIKSSSALNEWEKLPAQKGLAKLFGEFGGTVPTKSELEALNKVFPVEVINELKSKESILKLIGTGVFETLNVPRSIMSSVDLSAPFRQGIFMVGKKEFWKDLAPMVKSAFSEKQYKILQDEILSRPSYPLMHESKLAITDLGGLTTREETFMSNLAEKIPVFGRVIRGSGRAYTGFLSKLRADVFDDLVSKAAATGRDITNDKKLTDDIAKFINSATGRGTFGNEKLERAMPLLNSVLFSPRLVASRVNMLNPTFYVKLDPLVRKEAIKSLLSFAGISATVLGLAKLAGADVGTDPNSSDFGKIKIGNTRVDTLGGFQQYLKLGSQLISGKVVSSTSGKVITLGEGYKPLTRAQIIGRFFRGKENPVASFVHNLLAGSDLVGNKFNLTNEVVNRFVPMIFQDIKETLEEQGAAKTAGLGALGALGFGVQTYSGVPNSKSIPGLPDLPDLPELNKSLKLPDLPEL